jgi:hypothetical protein
MTGADFTGGAAFGATPADAMAYAVDAWQRGVLFLDILHRRGAQYIAHNAQTVPHVLTFEADMVVDGRTLPRPVNYGLVRIRPPADVTIDPTKRPFVVVDPRAGHGPGIGGFKADSEIGVAMAAGHPCYFVGFAPEPMPGQTIEDVARAQAVFLETVIAAHPEADGKPCVIGNCQAGWAVTMLAAIRPELFGPIIVAGAPLSYWAGVRGANPMRYSGGLLGGSWLTALTGDLGAGRFDGAHLVRNFENQNPANTNWSKEYNVYAKVDTEGPRYLEFERWWGGHVVLNAEEMQFIVDELFVGNNLAAGNIRASDGTAVDLRAIRSPILVFCSKGDNITPPQQALGWILDLYDSVEEILAMGQTIVYTVHDTVGHLGIFVSGSVARKQHDEFASNIDKIDCLPPGLYEAVFEAVTDETTGRDLARGGYVMRCEKRTLDDIRAMGGNDLADERRFDAAARVSAINLALYRGFMQPMVRAMVAPQMAQAMERLHPARLKYEAISPANPFLNWVAPLAEKARAERQPVAADNPFLKMQEEMSRAIVAFWEGFRQASEKASEEIFLSVYGNPLLQKAVGIDVTSDRPPRKAAKSAILRELSRRRMEELRARIPHGGLREAVVRGVVHVGMARASVDERGFNAILKLRAERPDCERLPLADFKQLVREQYYMLLIDEAAALDAIPAMLPDEPETRAAAFAALTGIVEAQGPAQGLAAERLAALRGAFGLDGAPALNGPPKRPRRVKAAD